MSWRKHGTSRRQKGKYGRTKKAVQPRGSGATSQQQQERGSVLVYVGRSDSGARGGRKLNYFGFAPALHRSGRYAGKGTKNTVWRVYAIFSPEKLRKTGIPWGFDPPMLHFFITKQAQIVTDLRQKRAILRDLEQYSHNRPFLYGTLVIRMALCMAADRRHKHKNRPKAGNGRPFFFYSFFLLFLEKISKTGSYYSRKEMRQKKIKKLFKKALTPS